MNRLQKKCLVATAGFHLLLILVLVFGSAFFVSHAKKDDPTMIDVIPAKLVDDALKSGVQNAQAPAPTPPQPPQQIQPPPSPTPPAPKPVVTPPPPEPVQKKEPMPEPEPPAKLSSNELKLTENPKQPQHEIKVSLTKVTRTTPKTVDTSEADAAREAQRLRDQRAKAFSKALAAINKNSSSATTVDMPGASSVAYANYKDALASIYYDAWTPPDDTSNNDAITKVRITIARDGTVVSARIIGPSGDSRVDASVQRAIDRVSSVPPLPEGAKENERTVILNFNLKTKRQIG